MRLIFGRLARIPGWRAGRALLCERDRRLGEVVGEAKRQARACAYAELQRGQRMWWLSKRSQRGRTQVVSSVLERTDTDAGPPTGPRSSVLISLAMLVLLVSCSRAVHKRLPR